MAKFFRRGVSKVRFLPAVAGTSPTRAEITAGTDLSLLLASITGFGIKNAPIETPNLAERFTAKIDGPNETTGDSAIMFYDDDSVSTIRTVLATGTSGYIVLMPYGDVPTKRLEKWQVKSTGVNDENYSVGSDPARYEVGFVVVSEPVQNGVVPT